MTRPVSVRGGAHSISVDFEQLRAMGNDIEAAGRVLAQTAGAAGAALADPAFIAAGVLDPNGALEVAEQAVATVALAGSGALGCEAMAATLRVAAQSYEVADTLDDRIEPLLDAALDLPKALTAVAEYTLGWLVHGGSSLGQAVSNVAAADPALADLALEALTSGDPGHFVAGLINPDRDASCVSMIAGALGSAYSDGRPTVSARPNEPTDDGAGPPRRIADLIRALDTRNESNTGGAIDVRFVSTVHPDGSVSRSAIVNITGSTDWQVTRRRNPTVSDVGTNLRALANEPTTYEAGVILALKASGVRPDEPIMLIGHSQGGLVAAHLAADLSSSRDLRITHVVTAGAPIGLVEIPRSVQVLSLENKGDVVPELDGMGNPTRPNQITVSIDRGGGNGRGPHDLTTGYLPGAADVDASGDPSVQAWLSGARQFLGGDAVTTRVFQVERQP